MNLKRFKSKRCNGCRMNVSETNEKDVIEAGKELLVKCCSCFLKNMTGNDRPYPQHEKKCV